MRLLDYLHDLVRDSEADERIEREVVRDKAKRRELLARIRAIEMNLPIRYGEDSTSLSSRRSK